MNIVYINTKFNIANVITKGLLKEVYNTLYGYIDLGYKDDTLLEYILLLYKEIKELKY